MEFLLCTTGLPSFVASALTCCVLLNKNIQNTCTLPLFRHLLWCQFFFPDLSDKCLRADLGEKRNKKICSFVSAVNIIYLVLAAWRDRSRRMAQPANWLRTRHIGVNKKIYLRQNLGHCYNTGQYIGNGLAKNHKNRASHDRSRVCPVVKIQVWSPLRHIRLLRSRALKSPALARWACMLGWNQARRSPPSVSHHLTPVALAVTGRGWLRMYLSPLLSWRGCRGGWPFTGCGSPFPDMQKWVKRDKLINEG